MRREVTWVHPLIEDVDRFTLAGPVDTADQNDHRKAAVFAQLVEKLGANILEIGFLIELSFLNGRDKLKGYPIRSLVTY